MQAPCIAVWDRATVIIYAVLYFGEIIKFVIDFINTIKPVNFVDRLTKMISLLLPR